MAPRDPSSSWEPPRLEPATPLPPYSYVPGGPFPHPISDPQGHSFGQEVRRCEPLDPACWRSCRPYLYGLDLFNHGYYWEAHEAWEGLWHACGRSGPVAGFLKGLIKLAAAGVKVREGKRLGVQSHVRRAAELFTEVAADPATPDDSFLGLSLRQLQVWANAVLTQPPEATGRRTEPVEVVFPFVLVPVD